jgi:hypothetical protein
MNMNRYIIISIIVGILTGFISQKILPHNKVSEVTFSASNGKITNTPVTIIKYVEVTEELESFEGEIRIFKLENQLLKSQIRNIISSQNTSNDTNTYEDIKKLMPRSFSIGGKPEHVSLTATETIKRDILFENFLKSLYREHGRKDTNIASIYDYWTWHRWTNDLTKAQIKTNQTTTNYISHINNGPGIGIPFDIIESTNKETQK